MKAEASTFLDVIDKKGFTDEASQFIYQHQSKLVIVILQKKSQSKHWKLELFNTNLELILTLKYKYICHHRGER